MLKICDIISPKIPEFGVRDAGAISIDVTLPDADKAYGIKKLMQATRLEKDPAHIAGSFFTVVSAKLCGAVNRAASVV